MTKFPVVTERDVKDGEFLDSLLAADDIIKGLMADIGGDLASHDPLRKARGRRRLDELERCRRAIDRVIGGLKERMTDPSMFSRI